MPYLVNDEPEPEPRAAPVGRGARALRRHDQVHPVRRLHQLLPVASGPRTSYVGPAAIVNAHRFIFDSRDEAADERLEILADEDGVWRCRTIFNCTDACPRGINITRAILEVSRRHRRQAGLSGGRAEAERGGPRTPSRRAGGPAPDGSSSGPTARRAATPVRRPAGRCSSTPTDPTPYDPDAPPVAVVARALGIRTNNVAEYAGLVLALREARRLGAEEIDLRLDSKLIVEQLNGRWRVKDAKLQGLFAEARRHLADVRALVARRTSRGSGTGPRTRSPTSPSTTRTLPSCSSPRSPGATAASAGGPPTSRPLSPAPTRPEARTAGRPSVRPAEPGTDVL